MGHQGGKISDPRKRQEYLEWLYDLEFNIFDIPKPDLSIILSVSPEMAQKLSLNNKSKQRKLVYLGEDGHDIHEECIQHLQDSYDAYVDITKRFPDDFVIIDCMDSNRLLSKEEIHDKIYEIVKKIL